MTSHASVNVMLALEGEFDIEFPDHMLKRSVFESIEAIRGAIARAHPEGVTPAGPQRHRASARGGSGVAGVRHAAGRDRGPGGARARLASRGSRRARRPRPRRRCARPGRSASTARRAGSTPRTGGSGRRSRRSMPAATPATPSTRSRSTGSRPLPTSGSTARRCSAATTCSCAHERALDRDRAGARARHPLPRARRRCSRRGARGRAGARR